MRWMHSSNARIAAFILLALAVTVGLWRLQGLAAANRERIADIQSNRVASCERTYSSYIEVFRPFFPSGPPTKKNKRWAPEQRRDWGKLSRTVERLKGRCDEQVNNLKEE
jgi:hypothetical protein